MPRSIMAHQQRSKASEYELLVKIASGGMATVYVGRRRDSDGRLWAIKRAHAHLLEEEGTKQMFIEEANVASRIRHPNVVAVLNIEDLGPEVRLILEYVEGGALSDLVGKKEPVPPRIGIRILLDAANGLHAAHGMSDENGRSLNLVHRDISPHNILIGLDGIARLTDFGIAKCTMSSSSTTTGALKGKLAYMSPEYVEGRPPDQRHDVFGLGVVIWETLTNRRLFKGPNEVDTIQRIIATRVQPVSELVPELGTEFDAVLAMALAQRRDDRFDNALAVASALESAAKSSGLTASRAEVGDYVQQALSAKLLKRREQLAEVMFPDLAKVSGRASGGTVSLSPVKTETVMPQTPMLASPDARVTVPTAVSSATAISPAVFPATAVSPTTLVVDSAAITLPNLESKPQSETTTVVGGEPTTRRANRHDGCDASIDLIPGATLQSSGQPQRAAAGVERHATLASTTDAIHETSSTAEAERDRAIRRSSRTRWALTAMIGLSVGGAAVFLLPTRGDSSRPVEPERDESSAGSRVKPYGDVAVTAPTASAETAPTSNASSPPPSAAPVVAPSVPNSSSRQTIATATSPPVAPLPAASPPSPPTASPPPSKTAPPPVSTVAPNPY